MPRLDHAGTPGVAGYDVELPATRARAETTARGRRKKIIGFDSWTGGFFNFERLLPSFNSHDMDFLLVHIGSWGSDAGRPREETIGSLHVRDITYYGSKSLDEILEVERPDAVILLSTRTFAHRAFVRYCMQRGIPSVHLYHGLANVQVTDDTKGSHEIDRLAYTRYVLSRIGKLATRTFPCYIGALLKTRARPTEWLRFIGDVGRFARGTPFLKAADDCRTTKCGVYTDADIEHAVRVYGFSRSDVIAVGNPDLVRFGLQPHMLGVMNRASTSELKAVMYVDTALALVGLLFKSEAAFIGHLKETAAALAAHGKRLAFKPHPAHDVAALKRDLESSGVEVVSNEEFVSKLQQCCACITEATSVSLVPALLGLPLLCACYGPLKTQRFGPVLTTYPRGHLLQDLSKFPEILASDAHSLNEKAVKEWIAFNSGPLPAEKMPDRVADIVEGMVQGTTPT